ncbi:GIY-YIG nuclease family protein [Pseudarthrobacter sp. NPDC058119]|uniref:GIY-YIG nuclease family protein n=1 Tax=Pseudarthrobacter sp. NPDC058119 TaxID=3346348 RepID=UPI0036D97D72
MDQKTAWEALRTATPVDAREAAEICSTGLYAWWDPAGCLSRFWPVNLPIVDFKEPLYVGDAPSGIATRILEMHLKTTRYSGLRRSLAALLLHELDLLPGITSVGKGKVIIEEAREQRLTDWMVQNLRLTWVVTTDSTALEKLIIADQCPPLNYKHATNSRYRKAMKAARAELCRAAARGPSDPLP